MTVTVGFDYGYDFSVRNRDARFLLGADVYHTDSFTTASTNDFILDGYELINGFVGVELDERWSARFLVRNLTYKRIVMTGSRSLGGFYNYAPREYMLTLGFKM